MVYVTTLQLGNVERIGGNRIRQTHRPEYFDYTSIYNFITNVVTERKEKLGYIFVINFVEKPFFV